MIPDDEAAAQLALPSFHRNLARAVKRDYWDDADPSTRVFLQGYAFGYAAETGPGVVRLCIAFLLNTRRAGIATSARRLPQQLLAVFKRALRVDGLALFFAVGLGGAKFLERTVYRCLLKAYSIQGRYRARFDAHASALEEPHRLGDNQKRERLLRRASTFLATTLSAYFAFGLQSRDAKSHGSSHATSSLPLVSFPRASQATKEGASTPIKGDLALPGTTERYESSTMDLTLFLFVRATDTALRALCEKTSMGKNKVARFLADRGDTLLFVLSSWRIMWVWFYKPWLLPPSYDKWIHSLARIDPGLLELLRRARAGEWVYGQVPATKDVLELGPSLCRRLGCDESLGRPDQITAFPCTVAHGRLGNSAHCEMNTLRRWLAAWRQGLMLYLPVHFLPLILFSFSKLRRAPAKLVLRALLGTSRSAAFIATFVAAVWSGVCIGRTRVGPRIYPVQQFWDGGAAMLLGCFMCGFSVLIENKRRRGEMALFVAPRALYAILDDVLPVSILANEKLAALTERLVFSVSSAAVVTAAVYEPHHIRGIVRSIARLLTKHWHAEVGL